MTRAVSIVKVSFLGAPRFFILPATAFESRDYACWAIRLVRLALLVLLLLSLQNACCERALFMYSSAYERASQ